MTRDAGFVEQKWLPLTLPLTACWQVLFNPIVERIANYRNCSAAQVSLDPPCAVS